MRQQLSQLQLSAQLALAQLIVFGVWCVCVCVGRGGRGSVVILHALMDIIVMHRLFNLSWTIVFCIRHGSVGAPSLYVAN